LRLIESGEVPDLVLLDLMMPGVSGFEVCKKIRLKYSVAMMPIILLTAKNQVTEFLKGMELGANDFLAKPFSKMELISRIKTHIQLSKLHKSYLRFVPADFLKQIGCHNIDELSLGSHQEKQLSILVSDIRNFSKISEQLEPKTVFSILNEYLNMIVPVIRKNHGFVIRFMGDAIVAFFPQEPDCAMNAALEIKEILQRWESVNPLNQAIIKIKAGIGLHSGKVILGTIGFDKRMDAAAISPEVDETMMLESFNKVLFSDVLITDEIWSMCHQENYTTKSVEQPQISLSLPNATMLKIRELLGFNYPELKS
jgi:two-component system sensor histidine kinase ChiS